MKLFQNTKLKKIVSEMNLELLEEKRNLFIN